MNKRVSAPAHLTGSEPGDPNLGACLRAIRERKGWTLAMVSEMSGLAASSLSRVENDQMSLTYENLLRLCKGMRIDMAELFASGRSAAPELVTTGRRTHTPPGAGQSWQANQYIYRYLCTELANKKMTPIIGTILARNLTEAGPFLRHEGEEFVYVLDGTLDFCTEFYEPLRVEQGGCVYFDSSMGHAFVSAGDGPTTILSVCSSAEHALATIERAHAIKAPPALPPKRRRASVSAQSPAVAKAARNRRG